MFRLFLGVLLMSCYFFNAVSGGYNSHVLEEEADNLSRAIWARTPLYKKDIYTRLNFIEGTTLEDWKGESFSVLYQRATSNLQDPSFLTFSWTCKEMYEESDNNKKVGILMLFEEVFNKCSANFQRLQKAQKMADSSSVSSSPPKYFTFSGSDSSGSFAPL